MTGTHTIVAQPVYLSAASFGALLSSEVTGSLTADSGADLTLSRVGQDGRFTFSATAGDSLGFALSALSIQPQAQSVYATIYKPDGTSLTNTTPSPPNGGYAELGTLATTGTYTVGIDPSLGAYGTMRLTLKQGPLLATTDSPAAFAPATVTEAVRYRFAATAGQGVAFGITGMTNVVGSGSSTVNVYAPDRSIPVTTTCSPGVAGGTCKLTLVPAVTGTYALAIVPPQSTKISGNIVVSSDITGTLVNGTPQTITSTRSGQNARFTFSGTAGDSTFVKLYAITTTPASQTVTVRIYKPDGNALTSGSGSSSGAAAINLASLPTTGTYTVLVEPFYGTTWQGTLALDPGPLVTVDGATQALSSAAGEPVRVRFAGTAGQRMEWGISGLAYAVSNANATGITVYSPSGSTVTSQSCYTSGSGNCEFSSTSLPATGTYSVLLVPPSASAISAGTFAASTPLGGTFVISDPAQAVALTRPGQTARYTFSGTSGQLLRLNWSGATVSGGASVSISILKPDNSTLSSGSFANGASSGLDIASLPTTGTYTVVLDPSAAATMSASMSLVTR